jgi:antirestriction protein ArdC
MSNTEEKQDVYTRITNKIITSLERGVRPWMKPWNAEHAAGKITRPLRHNGQSYSGINILMLWASAMEQGFAAPIWMTFKQAIELNAHVRKGEKGSLVVYASSITRTEHDDATGGCAGQVALKGRDKGWCRIYSEDNVSDRAVPDSDLTF